MVSRASMLLTLCLATTVANGQIYKWTDEQGHVHYGDKPPAGQTARQVVAPSPSPGAAAQPKAGRSGAIPAPDLPKLPPEEAERRRRIVEQMDREDEEKQRAALRDSPDGRRACGMLQTQIWDAEAGVLRGRQGQRKLTVAEQSQILRALRQEYDKACR